MPPETAKPTAGTVGSISGSGESPTRGFYTAADQVRTGTPKRITDQQWEATVMAVVNLAGGDSERGERARRAVHALCGQPFVSRPLWAAALGVAWVFIAAVMSGNTDLRSRANALIKQVLSLAAESRESLGRAA